MAGMLEMSDEEFKSNYAFLGGSVVKNPPANAGDVGLIPGAGRSPGSSSRRRKWQATPVFFPGKSYRQGSLVGYSPWGHKRVECYRETKQQ